MISGCGFKGNPVPYHLTETKKKPIINNLKAAATQENVFLKCGISRIKVD
jgi:hypothetical protein